MGFSSLNFLSLCVISKTFTLEVRFPFNHIRTSCLHFFFHTAYLARSKIYFEFYRLACHLAILYSFRCHTLLFHTHSKSVWSPSCFRLQTDYQSPLPLGYYRFFASSQDCVSVKREFERNLSKSIKFINFILLRISRTFPIRVFWDGDGLRYPSLSLIFQHRNV